MRCKNVIQVVVTNHLTTRISRGENQLIPALGECVGYLMDYRLMLGYLPTDQHFAGVIFKSPISQNDSAEFQVSYLFYLPCSALIQTFLLCEKLLQIFVN